MGVRTDYRAQEGWVHFRMCLLSKDKDCDFAALKAALPESKLKDIAQRLNAVPRSLANQPSDAGMSESWLL